MAGSGRPLKDPSERVNRVKPRLGEWQVLPDWDYEGPVPEMPEDLKPSSVLTWELWWRSPMAHMWAEAHHAVLVRLIRLVDGQKSSSDAVRITAIEDRFGLTPKGLQALRWRLPDTGAVEVSKRPASDKGRRARVIRLLADEA